MAYEVFKGLMQMENAKESRKIAKRELAVKEAYMGALTGQQLLQTEMMKSRLDAGLVELEREAKAQENLMSKQQFKLLKTRNRTIRKMLDSEDKDERLLATSALLGVSANQQSKAMIDALSLQNQQMRTSIAQMEFGLRQDQAKKDAAGEIMNLAMAISQSDLAKDIFGKEGDQFMKKAVRNAFIAQLGGELPDPETVPEVTPDKPGFFQRWFGDAENEPIGSAEESEALDSDVLEERLRRMRQGEKVK
jgi:hypothetical protein